MSEAKFSPLLSLARHAQRRRMEMQCDPQWVLDLAAERDALRAEVEQLHQALRLVIVAAGGSTAPSASADLVEQAPLEVLGMRGQIEQLERIARYLVRAYIVDDQAYNPENAADKAMERLKEQHK